MYFNSYINLYEKFLEISNLYFYTRVFVSDVLNFSFWSNDHEKCFINYNGREWTGYWSLCAVMNRALDVSAFIVY